MAETPEFKIETLVIAILQDSADLASATIGHYDARSAPDASRIGVQVSPKIAFANARQLVIPAIVWQATLTIFAQRPVSDSVADFTTWWNAIDAALMPTPPATYPAQVIADATTAFPNGLLIDIATGGDRQPAENDVQTVTRTFRVIWGG